MLYALLLVVCATSCLAEWVQRGGAGKQDREYWFSKHNNLVFGLHLDEGGQLPWDKAQESCVEKGGTLVHVRDIDEHNWIRGKQVYPSGFQPHGEHERFEFGNIWIGCRPSDGNSWKWINSDGSKSGCCTKDVNSEECFSEWDNGAPDNDDSRECVEMTPSGKWNDEECEYGRHYVCERPTTTTTTTTATKAIPTTTAEEDDSNNGDTGESDDAGESTDTETKPTGTAAATNNGTPGGGGGGSELNVGSNQVSGPACRDKEDPAECTTMLTHNVSDLVDLHNEAGTAGAAAGAARKVGEETAAAASMCGTLFDGPDGSINVTELCPRLCNSCGPIDPATNAGDGDGDDGDDSNTSPASSSAAAAIAVPISIIGVLLIVGAVYYFRCYRNQKETSTSRTAPGPRRASSTRTRASSRSSARVDGRTRTSTRARAARAGRSAGAAGAAATRRATTTRATNPLFNVDVGSAGQEESDLYDDADTAAASSGEPINVYVEADAEQPDVYTAAQAAAAANAYGPAHVPMYEVVDNNKDNSDNNDNSDSDSDGDYGGSDFGKGGYAAPLDGFAVQTSTSSTGAEGAEAGYAAPLGEFALQNAASSDNTYSSSSSNAYTTPIMEYESMAPAAATVAGTNQPAYATYASSSGGGIAGSKKNLPSHSRSDYSGYDVVDNSDADESDDSDDITM